MVAPHARKPLISTTPMAALSLVYHIAFITPSIKAATVGVIAAAPAFPAVTRLAALTVLDTTAGGTHAEAFCDTTMAKAPPETAKPCRTSRFARIVLAVANRLATVPSGQPRCWAASFRVFPSRSQRTTTALYFSGR